MRRWPRVPTVRLWRRASEVTYLLSRVPPFHFSQYARASQSSTWLRRWRVSETLACGRRISPSEARVNCAPNTSGVQSLIGMPRGGRRPGAGRPIKVTLHPSPESRCLEDVSGALQIDREANIRLAARALHRLIAGEGWGAVSELEVQLGNELAPLPNLPGIPAPETAPDGSEESLVPIVLAHGLSVNAIRYGPGRCMVPHSLAAGLENADRQAERQRRTSPVLQDRSE